MQLSAPIPATSAVWRLLLFFSAVAVVVPLWMGRFLPFADLPQHVAVIATLRHWWDPAWKAQQTYSLSVGQTQYWLYYVVGALLAVPLKTSEMANRVLLTLVGLAFPYSLSSLLKAARRDERLAVFGCAFFWNKATLMGLVSYVAAIPLTLWGLALAIRHSESPSRKRLALLALISLVLFYLHLSALLFFLPAAAICLWLLPGPSANERSSLPRFLWHQAVAVAPKLLWMVPVLILSLIWLFSSAVTHPDSVGWRDNMHLEFRSPHRAFIQLPFVLLDIWRFPLNRWCLVLLAVTLAGAALSSLSQPENISQAWRRHVLGIIAALAIALYFAVPFSIGWLWHLNERYAIFAVLLLPAIVRIRPNVGSIATFVAAAIAAVVGITAAAQIHSFQDEVAGLDSVLARAKPGKRLLSLMQAERSKIARFDPFHHLGAYYRASGGTVAEISFTTFPQSPLRYRAGAAPPEKAINWDWKPFPFTQADTDYFDYVLSRTTNESSKNSKPPPPWKLIANSGDWLLYGKSSNTDP